jgi:hypothetical protein
VCLQGPQCPQEALQVSVHQSLMTLPVNSCHIPTQEGMFVSERSGRVSIVNFWTTYNFFHFVFAQNPQNIPLHALTWLLRGKICTCRNPWHKEMSVLGRALVLGTAICWCTTWSVISLGRSLGPFTKHDSKFVWFEVFTAVRVQVMASGLRCCIMM